MGGGMAAGEGVTALAWLIGILAWAVPGAGHLCQGRWGRALLLGGAVWAMFIAGILLGGHLFSLGGQEEGASALLRLPPMIANLGSGVLYLYCWATDTGFAEGAEQAARLTFEYGNTFLLVSGLLNYLAMLDAFDIAVGRKS
ncbi:MAG TPA: DUF6677 family protein [Pyrinomonadaceae bacterium]|jgi:hypothetical protein